jgi:hypothetical protein
LPFYKKTYDNKAKECVKSLIFNALQTSLKRLIFNGFAVLGWVKGRVLSKDKVAWCLVLGLVLSKG